ncbi:MAG: phosphoribosyltransferase [Candidatus Thermoplasmatota archaeon]
MKFINCEFITWQKSYELATKLARKIKLSGYRPDVIIAIGRGGFAPARIICDFLNITDLTSIRIEHWCATELKKEVKLQAPLSVNVTGKRVLVVDDITDTGETLEKAVEHIKTKRPKEVRTAVLQHKTVSKFEPDYIAHKITKWRWIIYPWAVYEDLSGFIPDILKDLKEASGEQILEFLVKNFNAKISLQTLYLLLEELILDGKIVKKLRKGKEFWSLR